MDQTGEMPEPAGLRALVERAREGDEQAMSELYLLHRDRVMRFCLSLPFVPEADAPDIVQEVFVRALRHIGNLREPEKFSNWLLSIAHRQCLRAAGHQKRKRLLGMRLQEHDTQTGGTEEQVERKLMSEAVRQVMNDLEDTGLKKAAIRFYLEQKDTGTIADELGVPVSTVTTWLGRFRAKVRRRLLLRLAGARTSAGGK